MRVLLDIVQGFWFFQPNLCIFFALHQGDFIKTRNATIGGEREQLSLYSLVCV